MQRDDSSVKLQSIVAAVDFSDPSRRALQWAGALAACFESRLIVVSVVDPLLAEAAKIQLGSDLQAETDPTLREFVDTAWAKDGDSAETSAAAPVFRTPIGDPATAILESATAEHADLIVMGTEGLGGLRKWLLGSTTERLLRRTRLPVLTVPGPAGSAETSADQVLISHILVASDFSDSSVAAARMAAHLARVLSAELTLAHVVEPTTVLPRWQRLVEESEATRVADARAKLKSLAEQVCNHQKRDEVVAVGRAAEVIGNLAEDRRAQLIVMGLASDQGAFSPRPGAIAYRLLSSTTIPVLVVPGPSAALPERSE